MKHRLQHVESPADVQLPRQEEPERELELSKDFHSTHLKSTRGSRGRTQPSEGRPSAKRMRCCSFDSVSSHEMECLAPLKKPSRPAASSLAPPPAPGCWHLPLRQSSLSRARTSPLLQGDQFEVRPTMSLSWVLCRDHPGWPGVSVFVPQGSADTRPGAVLYLPSLAQGLRVPSHRRLPPWPFLSAR